MKTQIRVIFHPQISILTFLASYALTCFKPVELLHEVFLCFGECDLFRVATFAYTLLYLLHVKRYMDGQDVKECLAHERVVEMSVRFSCREHGGNPLTRCGRLIHWHETHLPV